MKSFLPISLIFAVIMLAGCGGTGKMADPLPTMATGGSLASTTPPPATANDIILKVETEIPAAPAPEKVSADLRPGVPRVKQAQVIGVVQALVDSGCMIKKVASTDGIHYSQLVVTCGDVQQAPVVK